MEPRTISPQNESKSVPKNKKEPRNKQATQTLKPHEKFNVFITPGNNEIWLCGLGLAWKELITKHGFKPEITEGSRSATNLIGGFMGNACSEEDVDPSVFYKSGISNETVNEINDELKYKFSSQFTINKVDPIKSDQIILYSGIFKKIKLKYPLFKIPRKIMHFRGEKVECYEPMEKQQRQQIFVVKYNGPDNFILRVDLLEKDSYMFIYRTKEKADINAVIETVNNAKEELPPLAENDVFKIPQIKFGISQYISDIIGIKGQIQPGNRTGQIVDCFETVNLQIIGQPHRERMDTLVLSIPQEDKPSLHSKRMAVRGPFWLVLKQKNKYPHFIMHVMKFNEVMK